MLVADDTAEPQLGFVGHRYQDGVYQLPSRATPAPTVPVLLLRPAAGAALVSGKARVKAELDLNTFIYPSVNVIARAPGADAALRQQHVLFSGHHDHDGVDDPVAGDSIWNGADDNATVSVAMPAIGRAGIPALFFTTLLHPGYHTPRDGASRIDIAKLARMTRWMYATGWAVSATPQRVVVDPGAKLER